MTGDTTADDSRLTRRQRHVVILLAVVCIAAIPIGLTAAQGGSDGYSESWNVSSSDSWGYSTVYENDLIVINTTDDTILKYSRSGQLLDSYDMQANGVSLQSPNVGTVIDRESGIIYAYQERGGGDHGFIAIDAETLEIVDSSPTVSTPFAITMEDLAFDSERDILYFANGRIAGRWDVNADTTQFDETGSNSALTSVAVDEDSGTAYFYGVDYAEYDTDFNQVTYNSGQFGQEMFGAELMRDRDRVIAARADGDVLSIDPSDVTDTTVLFSGVAGGGGGYDVLNYRENTTVVHWRNDSDGIGFYRFDTGNKTTIDSSTSFDTSIATWDWNTVGLAYVGNGVIAYETGAGGASPPGDLRLDVNTYMRPGTSQHYTVEFSLETEDTYSDVTENATVTSGNNDTLTVYPGNNTLVATGNTSDTPAAVTVTAEYQNRTTSKTVTVAKPSVENLDLLPTWWKVNATVGDGMMLWLIVATLAAVVATRAATSFAGVGAYVMFMTGGWMTGSVSDGVMVATILTGLFLGMNLAANVDTTIRGSG